ncbi:hypothetical protein H0H92_008569 [Tricholoma furcatifolium]|nr:hypothetical protein H0H92_008569 [Tricholoma furcatifolium]
MKQFNIVVLGAGGVGKSALTVRYVKNVFVENYDPTVEGTVLLSAPPCTAAHRRVIEEYRRSVEVDGKASLLEVLDTAGAEQFTSLNEVYIKTQSGRGFVLVFSLTNEASLREVDNLRKQIYRIKGDDHNIPIVVVGTKLDLVSEREVQRDTISSLANRWSLPFYETSAKKNWHIDDVFEDLVRQLRAKYPQEAHKARKKKSSFCTIM